MSTRLYAPGVKLLSWRERDLEVRAYSGFDRKKPPAKAQPETGVLRISYLDPPDLALFPNLRELLLVSLPDPGRLPAALRSAAALPKLDSLELSGMTIDRLPEELRAMTRLRWLVLNRLAIAQLPPWIGELRALESLAIDHDRLEAVPDELGALPKLAALTLGGYANDPLLVRLPRSFARLPALSYLYLYRHALPAAMLERVLRTPTLRHLGLHDTEIPEMLGELTHLESLSIEAITSEIPECVGELVELRQLRLLLSPFKVLPTWLPRLTKLRVLLVHTMIAMDMTAFVDLAVQLPALEYLFLWGAAPPPVKKKLVTAGFTVVRGHWHLWLRGKDPEGARRLVNLFPWR